jgi:hypothetical protein
VRQSPLEAAAWRVISDIVKRRSFRVSFMAASHDRYALPAFSFDRKITRECFVGLLLDRRSRRFDLASWSF